LNQVQYRIFSAKMGKVHDLHCTDGTGLITGN
jgi:hypothetical protein